MTPKNAQSEAEVTPHDRYVASGRCDFVFQKTWCNDRAGHLGLHWATHIKLNGDSERVVLPSALGGGTP